MRLDTRCFVLTPVGSPGSEVRRRSEEMMRYVIRPGIRGAGYDLIISDWVSPPEKITRKTIQHVIEAPVIVADLSGVDPKVLYTLALLHAIGKPVIHVVSTTDPVPFETERLRMVTVDAENTVAVEKASRELTQALLDLERHPRSEISSFPTVELPELGETRGGSTRYSRRIFVVHGHDGELKNELARLLEKLELEPVILHEQADQGRTIFAKLHREMDDIGFAFVLLTPDDLGQVRSQPHALNPRARQNVVLEHGLFLGHLGPERVCAIARGEVELPSDLHGLLLKKLPADGNIRSIAFEIVQELRAAGYEINANRLYSR